MPKIKTFFRFALYGAGLFWLPDTLMHAFFKDFDLLQMVITTTLMLLSVTVGLLWFENNRREDRHLLQPAMLVGIWLTAGIAMGVNGLFTGAGFAVPYGWTIAFTGMVPPIAFLMSSYDGSLFALSAVTIGLFCRWVWTLFHI